VGSVAIALLDDSMIAKIEIFVNNFFQSRYFTGFAVCQIFKPALQAASGTRKPANRLCKRLPGTAIFRFFRFSPIFSIFSRKTALPKNPQTRSVSGFQKNK
jgi:hypothetical protein